MSKYLNPDFVCGAFERLSSRNNIGKVHMERTSVLMYFLSVDATCKQSEVDCLDLNPDSLEGKHNRKQVELEFTKLVLLGSSHEMIKQVIELGKIGMSKTSPEKRISSNFFTVPLKKATVQTEPYYYPRRPPAPVLKMGYVATGKKWGISHHDNWKSNFLALLTDIKSSTPCLDLAIFVCKDWRFDRSAVDLIPAIGEQVKKRFTKKMSDFWVSQVEKEKVLANHINAPFIDHYSCFADFYKEIPSPAKRYDQMKKSDLIDRILQLESMLSAAELH